jgi:hypothetical protein
VSNAANAVELRMRRTALAAYIAADPVTISFRRYPKVDDGAGGWYKGSVQNIDPQVMRLVPYKRRLSSLTDHTAYGDIPHVQYSLVAKPDVDVQRWDEFTLNGAEYKVIGIEPKTQIRDIADRVTILIEIRDKET